MVNFAVVWTCISCSKVHCLKHVKFSIQLPIIKFSVCMRLPSTVISVIDLFSVLFFKLLYNKLRKIECIQFISNNITCIQIGFCIKCTYLLLLLLLKLSSCIRKCMLRGKWDRWGRGGLARGSSDLANFCFEGKVCCVILNCEVLGKHEVYIFFSVYCV